MVITGIVISITSAMPLAGTLADRGMPLLYGFAGMVVLATGLVFAAQTVFALGNVAASWVMQVRRTADLSLTSLTAITSAAPGPAHRALIRPPAIPQRMRTARPLAADL